MRNLLAPRNVGLWDSFSSLFVVINMKRALLTLNLLCWLAASHAIANPALGNASADLDHDGYKEGYLVFEGKQITKAYVDANKDLKVDTVIYYKNGNRDRAEKDSDQDGVVDTWTSYYFTGVPWKIAEDGNRDGAPDYWVYFKNGQAYKWELDRNFDGKADVQTLMDGSLKITRQLTDDDFDGFYEHMKSRLASAHLYPQSIAEALLR